VQQIRQLTNRLSFHLLVVKFHEKCRDSEKVKGCLVYSACKTELKQYRIHLHSFQAVNLPLRDRRSSVSHSLSPCIQFLPRQLVQGAQPGGFLLPCELLAPFVAR
jgi:hypothetical protein